MRLPELDVRTSWKAEDADGRTGTLFIDIHLARRDAVAGGGLILVDLVLADGRAFRRQLRASPDDARIIASFVSNLLLSIEEHSVEADREGVEIPETSEALDVARVVDKLDQGATEETNEATEVPESERDEEAPTAGKGDTSAAVQETQWHPWELGARLGGSFNLAVGPPGFADSLAGGGGSAGVDLRRRDGLLVDADIRVVGESKTGASLLRIRGALGVGYAWRQGRFALPLSVAYTLEGYRLNYGDSAVSPLELESPSLLNGLRLRGSPSIRFAIAKGPLRALRVGLRGELAGSFGLDDGPRVLGIRRGENETSADELFRLGGLELGIGIEFGADFGLRRRDGRSVRTMR
jgi:hypothetical protein